MKRSMEEMHQLKREAASMEVGVDHSTVGFIETRLGMLASGGLVEKNPIGFCEAEDITMNRAKLMKEEIGLINRNDCVIARDIIEDGANVASKAYNVLLGGHLSNGDTEESEKVSFLVLNGLIEEEQLANVETEIERQYAVSPNLKRMLG